MHNVFCINAAVITSRETGDDNTTALVIEQSQGKTQIPTHIWKGIKLAEPNILQRICSCSL
jgi:hypothetical protein